MLAVNIKSLYFYYQTHTEKIPILNNVNLEIKQGEFVAIQGPSGSGKSTLLYLLGCLLKPTSGKIELMGHSITDLEGDSLSNLRNKHIGFIFQHFHLLPRASVLNNILLPSQYSEVSSSSQSLQMNAKHLAATVGLEERLDFLPNQLSGGQQQRVAIARALMNNPDIILADEPTGSLDSKTSNQIVELLRDLNRKKNKTVIIITHDNEVAAQCDRVIRIKDGKILSESSDFTHASSQLQAQFISESSTQLHSQLFESTDSIDFEKNKLSEQTPAPVVFDMLKRVSHIFLHLFAFAKEIKTNFPTSLSNLKRNKARTFLTMIGISVGVAAVLAMLTLGEFTKRKILAGYAEMGVNSLVFNGYQNWDQKATDISPVAFQSFNWERDLLALKKIFPQIKMMSPVMKDSGVSVNFGGRSIENDANLMGVNEESILITKRHLILGRNFNLSDIELKKPVCIIGYDIAKELFSHVQPLGQVLRITQDNNSMACHIIGVFDSMTSNKEWTKPNMQIYLPFTFFQASSGNWWSSQIREVLIQVDMDSDIERTGKGIKTFFEQKYGSSGRFRVNSDSVLLAQMKRFLGLFTILLASIAFITLTVGGIGITNMMLVSVSERFREIGLRKAIGATDATIRFQFLTESMVLCMIAGVVGIFMGFLGYHGAIAAASKFVNKMKFEWTIDWMALLVSLGSIIAVGILSGLFPAIKAEKLQVIEALRSE